MRVKLLQTGAHVPWQDGEIVTVQVASVDPDGAYECETLETYPPDLKEKHQAELDSQALALAAHHETLMAEQAQGHAEVVKALRQQIDVDAEIVQ